MAGNLVFKNGFATTATDLFNQITGILTKTFSSSDPRGLGWSNFYNPSSTEMLLFSGGSTGYERIFVRLKVGGTNTYIDRSICQSAQTNGTMVNQVGFTTQTKIDLGGTGTIQYWLVGNQNFFYVVINNANQYLHHYTGLLNRIGPANNASLYGTTTPSPPTTTVPTTDFTIGTNTTIYLRSGADGYGGDVGTAPVFVANQILTIVGQASAKVGRATLNSSTATTLSLTALDGYSTFSSFAMIGLDPLPNVINTGSSIKTGTFLGLYDNSYAVNPTFTPIVETVLGVSNAAQAPTLHGVFSAYPIRIKNNTDFKGTLFGLIDVPTVASGHPAAQDVYQTYDNVYRFINMPDGYNYVGIGSII